LSVKRHNSLLGVLNMKPAYMPGCIRPEFSLTPDQRILCSDCCEKMYYVGSGSPLALCTA